MPVSSEHVVAFSVKGGIFGVSRLADHLTRLVGRGAIAAWHPGDWVGWPHVAINIVFDTRADADFARLNGTDTAGGDPSVFAPTVT
jgi:hypothetical protein